jgi:deoxyadenosine/deoxycytidine kinase
MIQLCVSQAYIIQQRGSKVLPSCFQRVSRSYQSRVRRNVNVNQFSQRHGSSASDATPFIPILVSIEGNIGAGKTTLLQKLRSNHPEWHSIDEPVDTWSKIKNEQGQSLFELYYHDRKRWSYTFQSCALLTRYENIEKKVQSILHQRYHGIQIFLTERYLDTDYQVFTKKLFDEGSITKIEIELYERLLRHLRATATPLSAIIHLKTPPLLCKDRIAIRGRSGEEAITLDYLESLNKYQSKWIESSHIPTLSTESTNYHEVEKFILGLKTKAETEIQSTFTQVTFKSIYA